MRDILFRGQTRKLGEKVRIGDGALLPGRWEYGGIFQGSGDRSIIYAVDENGHFKGKRPVYSDTVCQYTGLTDKNGVKIFEGDIVALPRYDGTQDTRVVIYNPARARFVRRSLNNPISEVDEYVMNRGCCKGYEVIGNIHDNPELLEADE